MSDERTRRLAALACLLLSPLLLACVTLPWSASQGVQTQTVPRWACPTPTPKPYGVAGPVKGFVPGPPDPTSGVPQPTPEYYAQWEQEYAALGGPPYLAPTPYTRSGSSFYLGQLVNLTPQLDAQVEVRTTEQISGGLRLSEATIHWHNRGDAFPFVAARQVVISVVQRADGSRVSGEGWSWSRAAAQLAARADDVSVLRGTVAAGDTTLVVPILAPDGEAQTLDLQLDLSGADGTVEPGGLRVQWSRAHDAGCAADGTLAASYPDAGRGVQGPPVAASATDVVAFAASQVGRPYCWGGKGWAACSGQGVTPSCAAQGGEPCWDCSGLTWGAYNAVGVTIGHGTANQSQYRAVWQVGDATDPASVAQPGDLLLFSSIPAHGRGTPISHVGIYAGAGLMIHAANYPDGVIQTPHIFENRYYKGRLVVITRPPRA